VSDEQCRDIGNLCPCFAAVFLARVDALVKNVDSTWQEFASRKGGDAADPSRN
jgi:hypothetical protein